MKLLRVCFLAVFVVLQTPALVLCESSFNVISSGDDSVEYNEELGEQESTLRDNQELKEQESSFRDNEELKEDSAVEFNEGLDEQESSFRDNEELKEDSSLENEDLGDSVDYNDSL